MKKKNFNELIKIHRELWNRIVINIPKFPFADAYQIKTKCFLEMFEDGLISLEIAKEMEEQNQCVLCFLFSDEYNLDCHDCPLYGPSHYGCEYWSELMYDNLPLYRRVELAKIIRDIEINVGCEDD